LLVPDRAATLVAAAMLLSSAYGFNTDDAKTADHFYTGFPSYWNVVVFYLFVAGWAPAVNLFILLGLSVLVFVPIRYLYPSRSPVFRRLTVGLGILWGILVMVMLWQMPSVSRTIFWLSLVFPVYYVLLSFGLELRRRMASSHDAGQ
jgi:phosphatidylcholine synthase